MDENYNIVALACDKWGYPAADLAGTCRMKYPPNIHIVRIRCTGRVNAGHILHAIRNGADGVMIVGCRKGECDYPDGNLKAARNVEFVKRILDRNGFGGNRVNMYFLSAAEAEKFVAAVEDILKKVEQLGPNPLKKLDDSWNVNTMVSRRQP